MHKFRYILFFLLLAAIASGCAATAGNTAVQSFTADDYAYLKSMPHTATTPVDAADIDTMWGLLYKYNNYMKGEDQAYVPTSDELDVMKALPDEIATVKSNGVIMSYELDSPGMGYSKGYVDMADFKNVTVYSYHMNFSDIQEGMESELVQEMYISSAESISMANVYGQVNFVYEDVLQFAGVPFIFAAFELPDRGYNTHLFFTGYHNTFFKVRYDCLPTDENLNAMYEFMSELMTKLKAKLK